MTDQLFLEHETMRYAQKKIELAGRSFGKWSVLSYAGNQHWLCRCQCGIEKPVRSIALRNGKSSGCRRCTKNNLRHGMAYSPEWRIWASMKARCGNPKNKSFKRYGARGIRVCARWLESFDNFIADMGRRPTDRHTIERRDNNGNYEPGNCRWATLYEQARNRRSTRFVEFHGRRMSIAEFCEITGLKSATAIKRIDSGLTPEQAASKPIPKRGSSGIGS